jgi:hypothetical protein
MMDITSSLLSYVKGHVFQIFFDTIIFGLILTMVAAFLFGLCNKLGWTKINGKGPRWFIIIFAMVTLMIGMCIGGFVGFQIGILNMSADITVDSGKLIIDQGLTKAANSVGIDLNQKIDVTQAKLFLEKLEKMKLSASEGWLGASLNTYISDMMLKPLVSNSKIYINNLAPGDEVVPAQLIDSTWIKVNDHIKILTNKKITVLRVSGIIFLLLCILVSVLIVSLVRVFNNKLTNSRKTTNDASLIEKPKTEPST